MFMLLKLPRCHDPPKLLDWGAVSADETGKFHDQLDCLNVALNDHQIQISQVTLFQNEIHFQGKRILKRQNVSFSAFKSIDVRKIKIIMKQRQGNTRKTHSLPWRKHNQGNTRSDLVGLQKNVDLTGESKCPNGWKWNLCQLRKGIKTSYSFGQSCSNSFHSPFLRKIV